MGGEGWGVGCVALAVVIELIGEPCFIVGQRMLRFRSRTVAEGSAVVARCFVTYGLTIWLLQRGQLDGLGVLPFGVGQLVYAIVLTGVYFWTMTIGDGGVSLVPRKVKEKDGEYWFHAPTMWVAISVTGQSLFKHVLTEGDKLVLTLLTTPYTQGIYAVVSNYGMFVLCGEMEG